MRLVLALLICLGASSVRADGDDLRTVPGFFVCQKEAWLTDIMRFAEQDELTKFASYFKRGRCMRFPTILRASLVSSRGLMTSDHVAIRIEGVTLWTVWAGLTLAE